MNDTQILESLGLSGANDELKQEALKGVNNVVQHRMAGLVDELMTEEQSAEFEKLAGNEATTAEDVARWTTENVTDLEELFTATLKDYLEEKKQQK